MPLARLFSNLPLACKLHAVYDTCPDVGERTVIDGDHRHSTSVSGRLRLRRWTAADHPDTLGQYLLELRGSAAGNQCPYQRQSVVVEICLNEWKIDLIPLRLVRGDNCEIVSSHCNMRQRS